MVSSFEVLLVSALVHHQKGISLQAVVVVPNVLREDETQELPTRAFPLPLAVHGRKDTCLRVWGYVLQRQELEVGRQAYDPLEDRR